MEKTGKNWEWRNKRLKNRKREIERVNRETFGFILFNLKNY